MNSRLAFFAACAVLSLSWLTATSGLAQEPEEIDVDQPLIHHLERSNIFLNIPNGKTHTAYEAQLAPSFAFRQSLPRANARVFDSEQRAHLATSLTFTMLVRLRQTTESSSPVRTPSYMPKLTFQLFRVKRADAAPVTEVRAGSAVNMHTTQLTVGHYSNGQDGCLFQHQQKIGDDCVEVVNDPPSGPLLNRKDGSFSTNYIQIGQYFRRMSLNPDLPTEDLSVAAVRASSIGIAARLHKPLSGIPSGMTKELRDLYGTTQVMAVAERLERKQRGIFGLGPGQMRLEAFAEYLVGGPDEVPPVRLSVEISRTYDRKGGWGGFARYYYGQDYYNLGFLTTLSVLQIGLIVDQEHLPTFKVR
ncbi:MAG: hypothetical protein ABR543_09290 [Gemmatimonadaceae bacterium]